MAARSSRGAARAAPPRREYVSHIEFGVFAPEEVKRFAVVNVTEPATYSASLPVANGTADHRMGSVDRRLACGTCKSNVNHCPGHAGMINLNYPVVHPSFLEVILKLLKTVCFFCSELLLSEAQIAAVRRTAARKQKLSEAVAFAKNAKACPCCGLPTPVYARQGQAIKCDFSKAKFADPEEKQYCERPFTSAEVRMILTMIRDENCSLLGLNPKVSRPENFVLTVMIVPPPIVRPSVVMSEGSKARGQDDLTAKICEIIKANANVHAVLEKEAGTIPRVGLSLTAQQAVADLAFHVTTFINNDLRGQRQSVQRSGLPTRSIISRLKGKEGRIRGYLMGKRVDFSARSVISPDSQMDVDQVGVPEVVAARLTVPIFVMESNLAAVRALVRDATSDVRTICRDGGLIMLEYADREKEAAGLHPGDVVERTLRDDDIVLFNRQPSLHKGSMMGYRVLICKGSRTFRLNLACTGVSNADYDGDEMNVHVPQDPEAQAEARHLMSVPAHIITAQSNKPSIGLVQDALIGAWLLTGDDVRLSRARLAVLHLCLHYPLRPLPPGVEFTGRQAFSLLLPPTLQYVRGQVCVEAGQLVSGRLCRQTLGTASGGLVHHLWLFEGAEVTKRFLSDAQRLINRWLQWRGFSIRLSDCEPDPATSERLQALVAMAEGKARAIADNEQLRQSTPVEVLEDAISTIANKVLTDAGKLVHASLDARTNALYQDITSGAKGNLVNITQLRGLVGQQSVEGQRVDPTAPLDDFSRKGFVRHSYFQGLNSYEFFAHTMAGREGLIDTSVKTATTGYLQRKLVKAKETARVCYDLTVRNSRNNILQFEYGGDGYDATFLVRQNLDVLQRSREDVLAHLHGCEATAVLAAWHRVLKLRTRGLHKELDVAAYVPVPFEAVLARGALQAAAAISPEALVARVDALCAGACALRHGRRWNLELLLRWHLRHEVLGRFTPASLDRVFADVATMCERANVAPGEAVGPLASTSIGEPLTQLTLNTFHSAGVKGKNVTLGVPRIKELIDCTKNPKTPEMKLVVLPSYAHEAALEKLCLGLVDTPLAKAILAITYHEEPLFFDSGLGEHDRFLARRLRLVRSAAPAAFGLFVARVVLNPAVLVPRGMCPSDVAGLLERRAECDVAASDELHDEWLLRVRFTQLAAGTSPHAAGSMQERAYLQAMTEEVMHRLCRDVPLGGLAGVATACSQQEDAMVYTEQGAVSTRVTTITTAGTNLLGVLSLPHFDAARCVSNDVHETLLTLGVEAATALLFQQIQFTLQFDGSYVNERHILLLVSFMTSLGGLLPVSRHGINKLVDSGPLARASFEEVSDRLAESAIFGDVDPALCHSAKIMIGERCTVGTGICDVIEEASDAASVAESDDVVFTLVEGDDVGPLSCGPLGGLPIEMPFMDESQASGPCCAGTHGLPKAVQASFLHVAPSRTRLYVPSSPKSLANERKRSYAPSSPRAAKRRRSESGAS